MDKGRSQSLPVTQPSTETPPILAHTLNTPVALGTLVISTILAYFTAEHLVESLNGIVEDSNISREWLTLIIIPIVSNAAEHATAVVVAAKGRFELGVWIFILAVHATPRLTSLLCSFEHCDW